MAGRGLEVSVKLRSNLEDSEVATGREHGLSTVEVASGRSAAVESSTSELPMAGTGCRCAWFKFPVVPVPLLATCC